MRWPDARRAIALCGATAVCRFPSDATAMALLTTLTTDGQRFIVVPIERRSWQACTTRLAIDSSPFLR